MMFLFPSFENFQYHHVLVVYGLQVALIQCSYHVIVIPRWTYVDFVWSILVISCLCTVVLSD